MAKTKKKESVGDLFMTIVYALIIAGLFRTFLFQPFWIPSGSMKSTLLIGDFLFVSKFSYGYSKYSFPWSLGPFDGRIFASQPERGDVIVFKHPRSHEDYVKRLIGLPGDRIQMIDGVLNINGKPVKMRRDGDYVEPVVPGSSLQCIERFPANGKIMCRKEKWLETLPNGVEHIVLNADNNKSYVDNTNVYVVPEGHYFFMGDNRDNSNDSRQGVGMVPFENLEGRADLIALSFGAQFWEFWDWRANRFFKFIK